MPKHLAQGGVRYPLWKPELNLFVLWVYRTRNVPVDYRDEG
jgi:hypothetical protein